MTSLISRSAERVASVGESLTARSYSGPNCLRSRALRIWRPRIHASASTTTTITMIATSKPVFTGCSFRSRVWSLGVALASGSRPMRSHLSHSAIPVKGVPKPGRSTLPRRDVRHRADRDTLTTGDAKDYAPARRNRLAVLLYPEGRSPGRSLCPGRRSLALAIGVAAGELDQHASGLGDLRRVGGLLPPPLAEAVVVVARDHVDVQVEDGLRPGHPVRVGLHEVDPARLERAGRQARHAPCGGRHGHPFLLAGAHQVRDVRA